jgi:mannan endo-1,4-beta-mannosidase
MRWKQKSPFIAVVFVSLLFSSCSLLSLFGEHEGFIRVRGTQLVHNGAPYYFTGTNFWYGGYLGSTGSTGDRPRLLRELDSMKANNVVNLRVLAASEESYIGRSVKPAIQRAPGVVDDSLLQGLDYLLAQMAKRKMHAVLFLGNYWEWSGGMAQYNVWTGAKPVDPEDPTQGWGAFMDFSATFYSNAEANQLYRNYVRLIVTRRNTVNGRLFSEDPTIMAWQLANEPRPGRDNAEGRKNLPDFYRWIDEAAKFIHSLDTNHLVSAGSEGTVGTLQSEEYYLAAYRTPSIDYLDFHLWPLNWGWFDPKRWEETLPSTETKAVAYINEHIALARWLGKPIVMEEFGLGRDGGEILPGTLTRARDRFYQFIYQVLEDSARAGAPIAGSNFWGWGGEGRAQHPDGMWRMGDSFVCDPPQEPQGLNSVFVTDTSTLRIIQAHGRRMLLLGTPGPLAASKERE